MSDSKDKKDKQLSIHLDEKVADGIYSNLAVINHSPSEFVLDFIQVMPGMPKANVKSRMILTPQHAKRFAAALVDNIRKFESQFGEIEDKGHQDSSIQFSGPAGQA